MSKVNAKFLTLMAVVMILPLTAVAMADTVGEAYASNTGGGTTGGGTISDPYTRVDCTINQMMYVETIYILEGSEITIVDDYTDRTLTVSGASWLSVSGKVISGTAGTPGDYTVAITASGFASGTQTIVIHVVPQPTFASNTGGGTISDPYTRVDCTVSYLHVMLSDVGIIYILEGSEITIVDDTDNTNITVSGASWLSVSGKVISGTAGTPGVYTVTVTSSIGDNSATQTFVIHVVPQLTFESLPSAGFIIKG